MKKLGRRKFIFGSAAIGVAAAMPKRVVIAGENDPLHRKIRQEIGNLIFTEHAKFNSGIPLEKFLYEHEKRFNLIFWAMNLVWRRNDLVQDDVFRFLTRNWKTEPTSVGQDEVFDFHTHYVNEQIETFDHHARWTIDYASMGNLWWFCPERFEVTNSGRDARIKDGLGPKCHKRKQYLIDMQRSDTKYFILTTAPLGATHPRDRSVALDGENDLISCKEIAIGSGLASNQRQRAFPSGVITSRGDIFPSMTSLDAQTRIYWKIYPRQGTWAARSKENAPPYEKAHWLLNAGTDERSGARGFKAAFHELEKAELDLSPVVCIHWSKDLDNIQPFLKEAAALLSADGAEIEQVLSQLASNHPTLKFVIFHAAHPDHSILARCMNNRINLYGEIGGVFSACIMDLARPLGTREFLTTLWKGEEGRLDNSRQILWGTDAIWYGSPQWQIEAFRRLRLTNGRRPTKEEIAFKRRVFAQNALAILKPRMDRF
jgi:hypothetical protein